MTNALATGGLIKLYVRRHRGKDNFSLFVIVCR